MSVQERELHLILYMTLGCHLCEQAETLVRDALGLSIGLVEIADDAELLERYGVRIPVLRRCDNGEELNWPFDAEAVRLLLVARRSFEQLNDKNKLAPRIIKQA